MREDIATVCDAFLSEMGRTIAHIERLLQDSTLLAGGRAELERRKRQMNAASIAFQGAS
jgi:hypothetical protein